MWESTESEEIAQRGDALYEQRVRPNIDEEKGHGSFVAIDVKSEDWEQGDDELEALDRLEERHPDAEVWLTASG
jgi:hypothetical protein